MGSIVSERAKFIRGSCLAATVLLRMVVAAPSVAAPFVNLDFEQATVIPTNSPHFIDAAAAFPGWTPRIGSTVVSEVTYDSPGIGTAVLALYDEPATDIGIPLLQGQYMAVLVTEFATQIQVSLTQHGDVPAETKSLQLLGSFNRGPPLVTINGTSIPMVSLGHSENGTVFGGDANAFAGLNVELSLASNSIEGVDGIRFSASPIPDSCALAPVAFSLSLLLRATPSRTPRARRDCLDTDPSHATTR